MKMSIHSDLFQTTMVCIDSYENKCAVGSVYNSFLQRKIAFRSTMEMLLAIESVLEEAEIPQSYSAKRSFAVVPPSAKTEKTDETVWDGKLATFAVKILFRQNAGWQGVMTWCEGRCEESFRSVLEMLLLMNSALEKEKLE
ncbi:MAG: hypothetical protein IJC94_02195 [Oscillospiraceae bacterium]|nr:hypothetical protein [Oscillospiraceae bacterium]MBQ9939308.1 hypothetical protein [Oscillospiraceae bacterium]